MSEYVATRSLSINGKVYRAGDAVPAVRLGERLVGQLQNQRKIAPKEPAKDGRRKA